MPRSAALFPAACRRFRRTWQKEGVLIRNFKLVDAGQSREAELNDLLLSARWPTRSVRDNLADVSAQVAANKTGVMRLQELVARYSLPVVHAYMRHIQDAAERKMRLALAAIPDGVYRFEDHLDQGSTIAVSITINGDNATVDFTGTGPVLGPPPAPSEPPPPLRGALSPPLGRGAGGVAEDISTPQLQICRLSRPISAESHATCGLTSRLTPGRSPAEISGGRPAIGGLNLHANRAIVSAAVLYVFRCLINEDIPLNSGVLAPVRIVLPECLLNPPEYDDPEKCAAIVGGNVETSQRVVDVLFGALGAAAASQGTMNNLTFGDDTFGYYETICGGSGATRESDGADAVHTHMTNTRLTDPEVIERRYPVRVSNSRSAAAPAAITLPP